jgi:hypothetical protein
MVSNLELDPSQRYSTHMHDELFYVLVLAVDHLVLRLQVYITKYLKKKLKFKKISSDI